MLFVCDFSQFQEGTSISDRLDVFFELCHDKFLTLMFMMQISMAARLLHLMRNSWIKKIRLSNHKGLNHLFEAHQHIQTMNPQYPPSLNRIAFLPGKFPTSPAMPPPTDVADGAHVAKDPVYLVMNAANFKKKEAPRRSLRSRLNIGGKFIKDVAITVTEKNEISLSQRLKNVLADYGKVHGTP